jgi:hypothetical protein
MLSYYILLTPRTDKSVFSPLFSKERGQNTEGVMGVSQNLKPNYMTIIYSQYYEPMW